MHQQVLCGSIAISMVQLKLSTTYWCFLGPICSAFDHARFLPDKDSSLEADWLMMKRESWVDECLGLAGWGIERMDCPFIPLLLLTRAWQVYLWHVTIGVNASRNLNLKRSQVTLWREPTWWSSNSVPTLAREISQSAKKVWKLTVLSLCHLVWCPAAAPLNKSINIYINENHITVVLENSKFTLTMISTYFKYK